MCWRQNQNSPRWSDIIELNRIIRSLKQRDIGIVLLPIDQPAIVTRCESSFQNNRDDCKTQQGLVVQRVYDSTVEHASQILRSIY